jgi:hypothetical protein
MEVVRGIKSPACHTKSPRARVTPSKLDLRISRKNKASRNQNRHCDKMGWRSPTAAVSRKAFPRLLMTYQFACRTQISRVLRARPAEAFGSGRFLQSMQLDLSLRDMFHLV